MHTTTTLEYLFDLEYAPQFGRLAIPDMNTKNKQQEAGVSLTDNRAAA